MCEQSEYTEPGLQFAGIGSFEDLAQSLDPQHFHLVHERTWSMKNGSYTSFVTNVLFLVQLYFEHINELNYYVKLFSNVNFNIASISSKLFFP